MIIFRVRSKRLFRIALLFVEVIAITEFKESQIGVLAVGIVRDALQSAKEQRLAHGVQVRAKRVHQHYEVFSGIRFQSVIICGACQRVIQNLIETAAYQLLGNQILQSVGLIPFAFRCQAGLQSRRNLHIIISVNTENIFYYIAVALYIHTVRRNVQRQSLGRFTDNLHFQTCHDTLYGFYRNNLANQRMYLLIRKFHSEILDGSGAYILYIGRYGTAGKFLHHQCRQFQAVKGGVRVDTSFKAERSIRIQAMTTGGLAHPGRMKISAFKEYIFRSFRRTGIQSAEYSGNTHSLFPVANHQVAFAQFAFHTVQSNKGSTFGHGLYYHLAAFNLVGIEAMKRLAERMNDVVRNVHHIVNRTEADDTELVLQPFRALLYGYAFYGYSGITRTSLAVFHRNLDVQVVVLNGKSVHRRLLQRSWQAVLYQISVQIASHAVV